MSVNPSHYTTIWADTDIRPASNRKQPVVRRGLFRPQVCRFVLEYGASITLSTAFLSMRGVAVVLGDDRYTQPYFVTQPH